MQEIYGDLFDHNENGPSAICLTTNGFVSNGANTMGRGSAGTAKVRWPGIQVSLGGWIQDMGNRVYLLTTLDPETGQKELPAVRGWPKHSVPYDIFSFPTKNHWKNDSDLKLIQLSAQQLLAMADDQPERFQSIVIGRPGCGLGNLSWTEMVRPVLAEIWDDRFWVIHHKKE